jgi:hypothetical protein
MKKNFGTFCWTKIVQSYKCWLVNPVCNATSCYDCIWWSKIEKEVDLAAYRMPWSRKIRRENP